MSFFAVMGFGLIATVLLIVVRKERPELAVLLSLAASALILSGLLKNISQILTFFETLASKAQINSGYLKMVVKIIMDFISDFLNLQEVCKFRRKKFLKQ